MAEKADIEMGKTFTALVRLHEANCAVDYPTAIQQRFSDAICKKLALELNLKELIPLTLSGSARGVARPAVRPPGK
ncbi:MAG: hypothetical protein ABSA97_07320 [Verrucomicrobiia bacterium]